MGVVLRGGPFSLGAIMARPKKETAETSGLLTVIKADTIADGKGGFLNPGTTFAPADDAAKEQLIARGLAK